MRREPSGPRALAKRVMPPPDPEPSFELDAAAPVPPAGRVAADGHVPFSPAVLLKYRWSIVTVFSALFVLASVVIWTFEVPQYRATAIVEVSPVRSQLTGSDVVVMYESFRASQVDYIKSSVVLERVLDRISRDGELRQTDWYRDVPVSPLDRLRAGLGLRRPRPPQARLAEDLSAVAPPHKQLVYVSLVANTPGEAKRVVDAVLDEFVRFSRQRASDGELELMQQLRKEIAERERELRGLEDKAASVRVQLGTGTPGELVTQGILRLDELEARVRTLETDIEFTAQMLALAESHAEPAAEPVAPSFEDDEIWRARQETLRQARQAAALAGAQFGETHPRMVELQQKIELAEADVRGREAELSANPMQPRNSTPQELREDLREMNVRLGVLKQLVGAEQTRFASVSSGAETLTVLDTQRKKTEDMQQQLARRLELLEMNREVAGVIRALPATEPGTPENDQRFKLLAVALAGAAATSVGVAYARVRLSPTVSDVGALAAPTSGVFLGRLPLRRGRDAAALEECPLHAEAVRVVRTALLNRLHGSRGSAVQITGASVGAGKSTLACLLSRSLAQCGKRTLLVDADLRRPTLNQRFAIDCAPGLLDVLAQRVPVAKATHKTSIPRLSVLTTGHARRHEDLELLANGALAELLRQWRNQYDVVVIDSPPLLGTADAGILSRVVDGSIFVVRERHCRRAELLEGLAALSAAGGKFFGTVFVGSGPGGPYGYGYYGYGYAYGGAAAVTTGAARAAGSGPAARGDSA